jgi:hypothetical protein
LQFEDLVQGERKKQTDKQNNAFRAKLRMSWLPKTHSIALFLTFLSTSNAHKGLLCSVTDENQPDPALQVMEFDVGDGKQSTLVYVEPPIESFYQNQELPAHTKVTPMFNGLAAKLINMSNKQLTLYWYV